MGARQVLEAIGEKRLPAPGRELTRDQVYIANVVKCRPPENADPQKVSEIRQMIRQLREKAAAFRCGR